jgi:cyclophilin family peptidyl-prolyl cis-trans isomerase
VQGGDPDGTGRGGGKMPSELNDLPFTKGSAGIARGPDIKVNNDSQWFIAKSDASWLDRQYTNFGQVTAGQEVVDGIRIGDRIKKVTVA